MLFEFARPIPESHRWFKSPAFHWHLKWCNFFMMAKPDGKGSSGKLLFIPQDRKPCRRFSCQWKATTCEKEHPNQRITTMWNPMQTFETSNILKMSLRCLFVCFLHCSKHSFCCLCTEEDLWNNMHYADPRKPPAHVLDQMTTEAFE